MNLSNENDKFTVFVDKNECLLSPCQNNGTCINSIGSYQCNCEAGWQDKDCEQGIRMFHIPLCLYTCIKIFISSKCHCIVHILNNDFFCRSK